MVSLHKSNLQIAMLWQGIHRVMHYIKGNVLTVYWQLVALVRHIIAFQGRIAMYSQYINTVLNFVY